VKDFRSLFLKKSFRFWKVEFPSDRWSRKMPAKKKNDGSPLPRRRSRNLSSHPAGAQLLGCLATRLVAANAKKAIALYEPLGP